MIDFRKQNLFFANTILRIFTIDSKRSYRILFGVLFLLILFFSALKVLGGLSPIWAPWDMFEQLNGGWRIVSGQIPHTDYYNPIGALVNIPTALAMKLISFTASSFVYGNVVFGCLLALWAWNIAKNRLSSLNTFVFSFFIFILAISTRPLGYGITNTTYAMIYNRYGYSLFLLLLILLFVNRRASLENKNRNIINGLFAGILLALLLYCKITYFILGFALIIFCLLFYKPTRAWIAMFLIGFLLIVVGMFIFFHINIAAYISDISVSGQSQSMSQRLIGVTRTVRDNLFSIYIIYLLLFLLSVVVINSFTLKSELQELLRLWLTITMIIISGMLLAGGNASEGNDVPIFFAACLILYDFGNRHIHESESPSSNKSIIALLIILIMIPVFFSYTTMKDIASIGYSTYWDIRRLKSVQLSQRFQSDALYDFVIPSNSDWATAYWTARDVPGRINEGLALLRHHINHNSRIFCLCFTDPFSFGLGLSPAVNTPLWWDENFSFNAKVYPKPEVLFQSVDFVIEPVFTEDDMGCCKDTVSLMGNLYGEYLKDKFSEIDYSSHWLLLARRK